MHISVTLLFEDGKRRTDYAIKTQVPTCGWLEYEVTRYGTFQYEKVEARLLSDKGTLLLSLDKAKLLASRGRQGALIEGTEYRKKGVKHSISDRQAWWCEAPPRTKALLDHGAMIAARLAQYERMKRAWDAAE